MKRFLAVIVAIAVLATTLFIGGEPCYAVDKLTGEGEWTGTITLGGSMQTGNTDKSGISFAIGGEQILPRDRYKGKVEINYAKDGSEVIERNIYGVVQADHFITSQVYGYLNTALSKDTFKNLNLRAVVGPGVGIQLSDGLSLEAGLAYFSEDLVDGVDDQWVTTRGAVNYVNNISDRASFKNDFVINTPIDDLDDYKLHNVAEFISALSDNWNMVFANTYEYNKNPAENVKMEDIRTTAALRYTF